MATVKKTRDKPTRPNGTSLDLIAISDAGEWQVTIDETHTGPDKWFVAIESPSLSVAFQMPSLSLVDEAVRFLDGKPNGVPAKRSERRLSASLRLGSAGHTAIALVRDDEFDGRYFLVVGNPGRPVARLTIIGEDRLKISQALRQVRDSLRAEGLL